MDKRNWKLIYSNYSGTEKKAVELIYQEMGEQILRDPNVYKYHVLSCEHISKATVDKNAVVIGVYSENALIQKYLPASEIPDDGYVVKVMDNPDLEDCQLVLITALRPREVFYGAVDFVDDYFSKAAPDQSWFKHGSRVFEQKLPEYYNASAPAIKTRGIFTWGHNINNFESYLADMARLKLNTLILWNGFLPINIEDVIKEAHEYGIAVYLGYSWGWHGAENLDLSNRSVIDNLRDTAVREYEEIYAKTNADGIYFQSFTEFKEEYLGGKLIAEVVVDFVNETAGILLEKNPQLEIQFGLHASSVTKHMDIMQKIDSRVNIIWEDCGAFPYSYRPYPETEEDFEKAVDFTTEILNLRDNNGDGVLYKGQTIMDWFNFQHQVGPYVMGRATNKTIENDLNLLQPTWRKFQSEWIQNGLYAYKMTRHIYENCKGNFMVGMAGQLTGGMWFSEALCAQMLWECDKPYKEILDKVSKRASVRIV